MSQEYQVTEDLDKFELVVPLTLYLKDDVFAFELITTYGESKDKLLMMKRVSDFCYESLNQLKPHWRHFYEDPAMCLADVMNALQDHADLYVMKVQNVSQVDQYSLFSDKWCINKGWTRDLREHDRPVTSQGGQDGILSHIFSDAAIGSTNKFYVEIGFNSVNFDGGSGANTYNLHVNGWSGLLLDIANENPAINLRKHFVTADNIVSIFDMYSVPAEPDYVSIDIDSNDLWVFRAIVSSGKYRPRVLTVEFNSNLPFTSTITVPPNFTMADAARDLLFGASAGAIKAVAEEFGYSVVHVIDKLDLVLVRNDLMKDGACAFPFFLNYYKFAKVQHCIIEPSRMFHWIEYNTWRDTYGNIVLARSAAAEQIVSSVYSRSPAKNAKDRELRCLGVDMTKLMILSQYPGS